MASRVIVRDLGYSKIVDDLNDAGAVFITVGVHGAEGDREGDDGPTNAMVAAVHEFGSTETTVPIPQRSFIRSTMDEEADRIAALNLNAMRQVADQKLTAKVALEAVGQFVTTKIKQKITSLKRPILSEVTIEARTKRAGGVRSDNPLIDTGQLRASITHVVHGAGVQPKEGS